MALGLMVGSLSSYLCIFLSVLFEKSSVFVFMLISVLESLKSIMKSYL